MTKRIIAAAVVSGIGLLISTQGIAATLTYTPSSSLPVLSEGGMTWPLSQINDGKGKVVAQSINGFGSSAGTGIITFTLKGCAKVDNFNVWNNINRTTNGITNYTLRLYGSTNHTLLKTIVSPTIPTNGPGGADVDKATLAVGGVPFVGSIEMEITKSDGRIEIPGNRDRRFVEGAGRILLPVRSLNTRNWFKMGEVYAFEHTPHPIEFEMYYSV